MTAANEKATRKLTVRWVDPKTLTQDPANVRRHPKKNIEALKGSLQRFGFQKAIVVDRNMVVRAGNGSLQAALELGLDRVPIHVTDLEGVEATAYAIADNRTSDLATWSEDDLAVVLGALAQEDAGLTGTGWTDDELGKLINAIAPEELPGEDEWDPDNPPDERARVAAGDLWALGKHRLLCGDSTDPANVKRLLGGKKWVLLNTDPPYGVDYEGGHGASRDKLAGDSDASLYGASLAVWMPHAQADVAAYLWFAGLRMVEVGNAVVANGLTIRNLLFWYKINSGAPSPFPQYLHVHEPVIYAVKGSPRWHGPTNEKSVWELQKPRTSDIHPTMKPVELFGRSVRNSSGQGELVVDPFLGSGTTIIACEELGRSCYGMELEPKYASAIVERWEKATGKKAKKVK